VSTSFDFDETEVFTTGTIGEPGQRVFYLQVRAGGVVTSFRLEKGQVTALAEHMARALADMPATDPSRDDMDLVEPVVAEWLVGDMGLGRDEEGDRLVVMAQELVPDDDPDPAREPAAARVVLTREQAGAFVARAVRIIAAGRPRCRLCGQPKDPDGHVCPRHNGHRTR
jgi:uncharacterized repeat protein (TIGR03847 family)